MLVSMGGTGECFADSENTDPENSSQTRVKTVDDQWIVEETRSCKHHNFCNFKIFAPAGASPLHSKTQNAKRKTQNTESHQRNRTEDRDSEIRARRLQRSHRMTED